MAFLTQVRILSRRRVTVLGIVAVVALLATTLVAIAATPLGVAGYLNHSYAPPPDNTVNEPTGKGAESKLWWHDGIWWGVLFSAAEEAFTIHRLDTTSNDWVDTGVLVDERITGNAARADVLWDEGAGKLYIATHRKQDNASRVNSSENWARLMVYSYNAGTQSWTLDSGYPVTINRDVTETLVLDKDSTGRLWVSYVSRNPQTGTGNHEVYVNASAPNDLTSWGEPFVLPFDEAWVAQDDISSLIAFADNGGPKVGVMWSNQREGHNKFYMAIRPDSDTAEFHEGWLLEPALNAAIPWRGDDHIKLARAPGGVVLAAVKTGETTAGNPLVGVIRRTADGAYSWHTIANYTTQDTRPTMVVDIGSDEVHVFTVSKEGGGQICIQSAPLATVAFHPDTYNCPPPPSVQAELLGFDAVNAVTPVIFIGDDATYVSINDPTTTKQMVTAAMGFVVLASDNVEQVYVHNRVEGVPSTTYGVELSADQAKEGLVGTTVVYNMSVTNTGEATDSFALTVNSAWTAAATPSNSGPLAPGASANFQVSVTIPPGAADGAVNVTTVTATSSGNNSVTDTAELTTTASTQASYGVDLAAATPARSGYVGTTVVYTVNIANTGNSADTFNLSVTGNAWAATVAPPSVTLLAGESGQVTVSVQIPAGADHGAQDVVTVTAISEGDPQTSDSVQLTTTAQKYIIFLPIIVKNG
jgi:hypothetical protein